MYSTTGLLVMAFYCLYIEKKKNILHVRVVVFDLTS